MTVYLRPGVLSCSDLILLQSEASLVFGNDSWTCPLQVRRQGGSSHTHIGTHHHVRRVASFPVILNQPDTHDVGAAPPYILHFNHLSVYGVPDGVHAPVGPLYRCLSVAGRGRLVRHQHPRQQAGRRQRDLDVPTGTTT